MHLEATLLPSPRLPIAGLTAASTTAFTGRLAAVVYLQGCPLSCGWQWACIPPAPTRSAWKRYCRYSTGWPSTSRGVAMSSTGSSGDAADTTVDQYVTLDCITPNRTSTNRSPRNTSDNHPS